MKVKQGLALMRCGILDQLQFRMGTAVILLGNLIYLIIIYFLWQAIFNSSPTPVVNGMTFYDTLIYLVLATALFSFMETYVVWEMGRNIQSGKIVLDLLKPMGYQGYMFFSLAGNLVVTFFLTLLPTGVIVFFLTKGGIPLGINLIYFIIAVIMGVIVNYFINFFVGTICLHTQSIWGINIMKEVTVMLLSGASIPIAFFPQGLQNIVYKLPFQAIYNTPLKILIDNSLTTSERLSMIGVQLIWIVVLFIITQAFWRFSVKKITVNGG